MRHITPILILLSLAVPNTARNESLIIPVLEKRILESRYRGDYRDTLKYTGELIQEYPTHPLSLLSLPELVHLAHYCGYEAAAKYLLAAIDNVRNSKESLPVINGTLYQINLALERLYYMHDPKKGRELTGKLNPVRLWYGSGPYERYGPGDLNYQFTPELVAAGGISGRKIRRMYADSATGTLDLDRYLFPRKGTAYVWSTVKVGGPVKIRFYSPSRYKVFINGKEALVNDKSSHAEPRALVVRGVGELTIMVKIIRCDTWKLRVLITGLDDSPARYSVTRGDSLVVKSVEKAREFFYDDIDRMSPGRRDLYRAWYHVNRGSEDAISFYRNYLERNRSPMGEYLLASALIRFSEGDTDSAKYLEGWKILSSLYESRPDFVPVRHKHFLGLVEKKEYARAFRMGKSILSGARFYPPIYRDMLRLAAMRNYDSEFHGILDLYKKNFPDSFYPLVEEEAYCREKIGAGCIDTCTEILRKGFHEETLMGLVDLYQKKGEYDKLLGLLVFYRDRGDYTEHFVHTYVLMKEYDKAKKILFREILVSDNPRNYWYLGLIDRLQNNDPAMYWKKMTDIDPSRAPVTGYLDHIEGGSRFNVIREHIAGPVTADRSLTETGPADHHSTVIYRNRVFFLWEGKRSRLYGEDIVHVHDREGVKKWEEVRVPYGGDVTPVIIKTIKSDGSAVSGYRIRNEAGNQYIQVNSLETGSLLHLSYVVENPVKHPARSAMFSLPAIPVLDYGEQVRHLNIKVICREKEQVDLSLPEGWKLTEHTVNGSREYSISAENLSVASRDEGSKNERLPLFSFSTMGTIEDIAAWYRGLLSGKIHIPMTGNIEKLRGESAASTVAKVYDFVSRGLELEDNILYRPSPAEDVLYKKKGSPEDKVILTRAILERLEIKSYPVFALKSSFKRDENYMSHERFSHLLVYVPIDISRGIWLDYSSVQFPCGTVDAGLEGTDGYIILKDEVIKKTIVSSGG